MKKLAFLPLAALALAAACADMPTTAAPDQTSLNRKGVSEPGTNALITVTIQVGSETYYRSSGPGNNGKGTCQEVDGVPGYWSNPPETNLSKKPHRQCLTIGEGGEETVTFTETATWVKATSGNENLNFSLDPVTGDKRGLQFKLNQNNSIGFGVLTSPDGAWSLDLSQPSLNDTEGNVINDLTQAGGVIVEVCPTAGGACSGGTMRMTLTTS